MGRLQPFEQRRGLIRGRLEQDSWGNVQLVYAPHRIPRSQRIRNAARNPQRNRRNRAQVARFRRQPADEPLGDRAGA
jgi:hypothetical protein